MNDKLKHLICGFIISLIVTEIAIYAGSEVPLGWGFGAGLLAAFGKEIIDNVRSWMKLEGTFKEKFKVLLNTTLRDSGFNIVATGLGAWIAIFLVQIIQLS